jgi:hypothetical protein
MSKCPSHESTDWPAGHCDGSCVTTKPKRKRKRKPRHVAGSIGTGYFPSSELGCQERNGHKWVSANPTRDEE